MGADDRWLKNSFSCSRTFLNTVPVMISVRKIIRNNNTNSRVPFLGISFHGMAQHARINQTERGEKTKFTTTRTDLFDILLHTVSGMEVRKCASIRLWMKEKMCVRSNSIAVHIQNIPVIAYNMTTYIYVNLHDAFDLPKNRVLCNRCFFAFGIIENEWRQPLSNSQIVFNKKVHVQDK